MRNTTWPTQDAPSGAERLGADGLGDAEDDAARERAPHGAHAAHDDRLEGVDEAERALRRVERRADRQEHAGDRDDGERDGHRQRVDVLVVDAHELGGLTVVRRGPEGPAQLGAARKSSSAAMTATATRNTISGNQPIDSWSVTVTLMFSIVPASRPCESAENHMISPFWMMIDRPKVTTIGRVSSAAERVVQQPALQDVADEEHDDDRDHARPEQGQAERLDDEERDERGEDAEVAVRQVDHAHDAEHQSAGRSRTGRRARPGESLGLLRWPRSWRHIPKYAAVMASEVRSAGLPSSATLPSRKQAT